MIYSTQDIINNFDPRDLNRGRTCQTEGRVQSVQVEGNGEKIAALVQGTAHLPYHVNVKVGCRQGIIEIEADCTCPVGYMCKHAVATLYEAIAQENRRHEHIGPHTSQPRSAATILSSPASRWVEQFEEESKESEALADNRIIYQIMLDPQMQANVKIVPWLQHMLREGNWSRKRPISTGQLYTLKQSPNILTDEDRALLDAVERNNQYNASLFWELPQDVSSLNYYLSRIIQTGRAFLDEPCLQPLKLGPPVDGKLSWILLSDGKQRATITPQGTGRHVLPMKAPWYFAPLTAEAGPLACDTDAKTIAQFLNGPAVTEGEANILRKRLKRAPKQVPPPFIIEQSKKRMPAPVPCLRIAKITRPGFEASEVVTIAHLHFDYGGSIINPNDEQIFYTETTDDKIILHSRDTKKEMAAIQALETCGLIPTRTEAGLNSVYLYTGTLLTPHSTSAPWYWHNFVHTCAPQLRNQGFNISADIDLDSAIVAPDTQDIDADFTQSGNWWFSMDLGIMVEGRRIPLLPILVSMIKTIRSPADLDQLKTCDKCYAPLPDGRHVALPAGRVHTILKTLIELFENKALDDQGRLRVSMDLTAAFLKLEVITNKRWMGEGDLRKLVEKLGNFEGIKKYATPKGLKATLRPYQVDGYNWLRFLGDYGLSGILADDMGLGKTVQALTYIMSLKEKKALEEPCLIVMPTSLIANWQSEAERFTPSLKILTLHGKNRLNHFNKVAGHDIVLTTYPLLPRDKDELAQQIWSIIILDEAQAIKNPAAKVTQAACLLQAKQRLCLTGTPVENHLGEAWSIFTFLMPGLLGNHKHFTRLYRNPIEKGEDADRKDLLVKRLRPFVLRRLKNDVAKELPLKTEIIRRVTLVDDQRDLYETMRHAMNDRVLDEIANKGLARSQIIILDALLKLRQTCCDPQLVKLEAARHVKSSAKLDELKEMLPTLIEDGRRILLFSQFTSMLDIIKREVTKMKIPFVELRGTTKDRATPIKRFQDGEVPLFLISLKAGGTGLNLTAADTVIHYDPWWNPSVENQATDRAHRIGQDKPVFVYKLITEDTLEERILELQTKKAGLANALFGDKPGAAASLTQEDVRWLIGD